MGVIAMPVTNNKKISDVYDNLFADVKSLSAITEILSKANNQDIGAESLYFLLTGIEKTLAKRLDELELFI